MQGPTHPGVYASWWRRAGMPDGWTELVASERDAEYLQRIGAEQGVILGIRRGG